MAQQGEFSASKADQVFRARCPLKGRLPGAPVIRISHGLVCSFAVFWRGLRASLIAASEWAIFLSTSRFIPRRRSLDREFLPWSGGGSPGNRPERVGAALRHGAIAGGSLVPAWAMIRSVHAVASRFADGHLSGGQGIFSAIDQVPNPRWLAPD